MQTSGAHRPGERAVDRRVVRILTTIVAAAAVVVAVAPASSVGQGTYTAGFVVITGAAWYGAATAGRQRLPWTLVAAALTSWLAGDLINQGMVAAGMEFDAGPPDVFWLLGYPLLGAGLMLMARSRGARQGRAALIDGFAMSTAAAVAAWEVFIAPQVVDSGPTVLVIVSALYPLGDVVLLAALVFLVLSPGARGLPTRTLLVALTLTLLTDIAFTLLPDVWAEADIDRLNGLLLVANGLLAAVACHPDRDELTTPAPTLIETLHPARVLFLTVALLTAPILAIIKGALPLAERLVLLAAAVITSSLGVARFTVAVRQQERMQRLLHHQATHDALTGLTNRRVLTELLDDVFRRPDRQIMLLFIDLDGFKAVNDTHGHIIGDGVLAAAASRISAQVRQGDVVARLGGDEFAVLCRGYDIADAQRLAERLCIALARPIAVGALQLRIGASVGIATAQGRATPEELIDAADSAMFTAKRRGTGGWVSHT